LRLPWKYIDDRNYEELGKYMIEERWQEVFLLAADMIEEKNSDSFTMRSLKGLNSSLESDSQLQKFLIWVYQKAASITAPYKAAAARALYFILDINLAVALELDIERDQDLDRARLLSQDLNKRLNSFGFVEKLDQKLSQDLISAQTILGATDFMRNSYFTHHFNEALRYNLMRLKDPDYNLYYMGDRHRTIHYFEEMVKHRNIYPDIAEFYIDYSLVLAFSRASLLTLVLENDPSILKDSRIISRFQLIQYGLDTVLALVLIYEPQWLSTLQGLRNLLPDIGSSDYLPVLYQGNIEFLPRETVVILWWTENGQEVLEQFQSVITKNRNIGHDWKLSAEQWIHLRKYYKATEFVFDYMNNSSNISLNVYSEIENLMLLPNTEIETSESEI
jgi:hypothetical protein